MIYFSILWSTKIASNKKCKRRYRSFWSDLASQVMEHNAPKTMVSWTIIKVQLPDTRAITLVRWIVNNRKVYFDIAQNGCNFGWENQLHPYYEYQTKHIIQTRKTKKQRSGHRCDTRQTFFNMLQIDMIHKLCNQEQFENISPGDMYSILNLHDCPRRLKIRDGEKNRVYYFIFIFGEMIDSAHRSH